MDTDEEPTYQCNMCGKIDEGYFTDITAISVYPGYGSEHDTDIIEFDLCDECLNGLMQSMVILPRVEHRL